MSKYNNICDVSEWSKEAVEMKAEGYSTRHIARTLFNNENYRNRLNAFFKRDDISDEIYHKACQIELDKQIEAATSGNDYSDWEAKDKPPVIQTTKDKPTIIVEIAFIKGIIHFFFFFF